MQEVDPLAVRQVELDGEVLAITVCEDAWNDKDYWPNRYYENDPVDVIIGDWMSEANMTSRAIMKAERTGNAYAPMFLEALEPALLDIARYKIKIAVNAGASDTELLYRAVTKMVHSKGLDLRVAWVSGDEVFSAVQKARDEDKQSEPWKAR